MHVIALNSFDWCSRRKGGIPLRLRSRLPFDQLYNGDNAEKCRLTREHTADYDAIADRRNIPQK